MAPKSRKNEMPTRAMNADSPEAGQEAAQGPVPEGEMPRGLMNAEPESPDVEPALSPGEEEKLAAYRSAQAAREAAESGEMPDGG
jgi:hypothetical protein